MEIDAVDQRSTSLSIKYEYFPKLKSVTPILIALDDEGIFSKFSGMHVNLTVVTYKIIS